MTPRTPRALAATLDDFLPPPGYRVGLLGGSFNPAHEGHRAISREALRRLALDEVWWLVSPQNPLKPREGMAALRERVAAARKRTEDRRIRVTAIEATLDSVHTAETLTKLRGHFPRARFCWLMGADNLLQVHRWQEWQQIFHAMPVAVLDRPSYSIRALSSPAARRFADARLPERKARALVERQPPAWVFLHIRKNPVSATAIRAGRQAAGASA